MKQMNKLSKLEKSWILYDIGNSAFVLFVYNLFPIYYKNIASAQGVSLANSTAYYGYALSISTIVVVLIGPILGGIADNNGLKKRFFTLFMMLGVICCAGFAIPMGYVALLAGVVMARVGFSTSLIFYDAMLVDITDDERVDNISSYGYALGYIGSCIPFIVSLFIVLGRESLGIKTSVAMGIAFILNATWWFLFSIPLLKNYKENNINKKNVGIRDSFKSLKELAREIKNNKKILFFFIAFFFYMDGVYTIIDMATSYGKDVGLTDSGMLLALVVTQIVAFPFAILFGKLAKKYKGEKLIIICILGYLLISILGLQLDKEWEFWAMAILVAMFQGGIQALSRSYFAKIIPKDRSGEYFGVFDILGKGASFTGTLLMGIVTQIFNTSRAGLAVMIVMFIIGLLVFIKQESYIYKS